MAREKLGTGVELIQSKGPRCFAGGTSVDKTGPLDGGHSKRSATQPARILLIFLENGVESNLARGESLRGHWVLQNEKKKCGKAKNGRSFAAGVFSATESTELHK